MDISISASGLLASGKSLITSSNTRASFFSGSAPSSMRNNVSAFVAISFAIALFASASTTRKISSVSATSCLTRAFASRMRYTDASMRDIGMRPLSTAFLIAAIAASVFVDIRI